MLYSLTYTGYEGETRAESCLHWSFRCLLDMDCGWEVRPGQGYADKIRRIVARGFGHLVVAGLA